MMQNVLRIQFITLFSLSLISSFYYFFSAYLPDNSLFITDQVKDYYSVLYYTSSLFSEIAFYTGPWICLPFLFFSFIYTFILSRRSYELDLFVFLFSILFFFSLSYVFFPAFLGEGLLTYSLNYYPTYIAVLTTFGSSILLAHLVLRGSFYKLLKLIQFKLEGIGSKGIKSVQLLTNQMKEGVDKYSLKVSPADLTKKTVKLIESTKDKLEDIKGSTVEKKLKNKEELVDRLTTVTPIIKDVSAIINEEQCESKADEEKKTNHKMVLRSSEKTKFFKSSDLIDCIAANVTHSQVKGPDESYFRTIMKAIEAKLAEFKLDGKIINILKGPVVDTFELELGTGVKVSKVTGLSDDIGLALNGAPIRIVYPMRGRSTIGIEVPRSPREFIFLDEVLQSGPFNDSEQRLPIAMGKDAFGDVKVVDLASMPHMLVAGATGAGKSVFINSLLVSLIVKKSPRELKLILIDPKQLELALFAELPHLMLPVLTDPSSSAVALLWAVEEMEKRYSILKEMGVKNIEGFNKKVKVCNQEILFKINYYYEDKEDPGYELPYIVVVIDEFADLILSKAGKEIENNVNRLAAKARAAGIHLVVATQRPSTDVVTGVVKANFPTRVAFRVSTGHDSKTILDQYGAEKLLGKGDMLYKHGVDLIRMHSSFVDEAEVEGLIEKLGTLSSSFDQSALEFLETGGELIEDEDEAIRGGSFMSGTSSDPMYDQALEVVIENGSASASMLQRRLRVGYNRAANLVEEMERQGIVGPAQGSKPRKVLARGE